MRWPLPGAGGGATVLRTLTVPEDRPQTEPEETETRSVPFRTCRSANNPSHERASCTFKLASPKGRGEANTVSKPEAASNPSAWLRGGPRQIHAIC